MRYNRYRSCRSVQESPDQIQTPHRQSNCRAYTFHYRHMSFGIITPRIFLIMGRLYYILLLVIIKFSKDRREIGGLFCCVFLLTVMMLFVIIRMTNQLSDQHNLIRGVSIMSYPQYQYQNQNQNQYQNNYRGGSPNNAAHYQNAYYGQGAVYPNNNYQGGIYNPGQNQGSCYQNAQYPQAMPVQTKGSVTAKLTVGFTLSLISVASILVYGFCFYAPFMIILLLVSLICGIVGLVMSAQCKKVLLSNNRSTLLATASIIISIIGICFAGLFIMVSVLCIGIAAGLRGFLEGAW